MPSVGTVVLPGGAVGVQRATVLVPLVPHVGDRPDGPNMPGEPLDAGRRVVVLGDPQPGPDARWVRVWVEPSTQVWPGDFYAWLPTTQADSRSLQTDRPDHLPDRGHDPDTCPSRAAGSVGVRRDDRRDDRCANRRARGVVPCSTSIRAGTEPTPARSSRPCSTPGRHGSGLMRSDRPRRPAPGSRRTSRPASIPCRSGSTFA